MGRVPLLHMLVVTGVSCSRVDTNVTPLSPLSPPVAQVRPYTAKLHGVQLIDEYSWLANLEAAQHYISEENAYASAIMSSTSRLQQTLFQQMINRISVNQTGLIYQDTRFLYYTRTPKNKQYPKLYRKQDSKEQLLLDVNDLATGHRYLRLGFVKPSPDHRILAYSVDSAGSEEFTTFFMDVESGEQMGDPIAESFPSGAWAANGEYFFYLRIDHANRPHQMYRHRVGAFPAQDTLLFEETDERFHLRLGRTQDRKFIVLTSESGTTSEVRVLDSNVPQAKLLVIEARREGVLYNIEHFDDRFIIVTNLRNRNFDLMTAPERTPGSDFWSEMRPRDPDVLLESVIPFKEHWVILERENGLSQLTVMDVRTGNEHLVSLPDATYNILLESNEVFDTSWFRFGYVSPTTPRSVLEYHMGKRQLRTVNVERIPGYKKALYESERLHALARDGASVPISLVRRRTTPLDGTAHLLLRVYGAYGYSFDPTFNQWDLNLLDRGFIIAVAHVRGGGELGSSWYESGRLQKKEASFNDYIDCAQFLIGSGYSSTGRIVAGGFSAGGLIVGVVINRHPELFGAAVVTSPFVDVLTSMLDPSLPLTVTEYDEWGDPRQENDFRYMLSYDPYQNVTRQNYPHILAIGSLNDPRVPYWQPAKWVARLRRHAVGNAIILLRTLDGGHEGDSGRYNRFRMIAFKQAFMLKSLQGSSQRNTP